MNTEKRLVILSRTLILLFIALTIYPIIFVTLTSFKTNAEFYTNIWLLPRDFILDNYPKAWVTANLGIYFFNSLFVVSLTVAASLFMASLAGYALARLRVPRPELIMFVILLCTMLPSESILMPAYLTTNAMRITGTRLSLILPYIGWGLPMTIYIYRNFFRTLPVELIEAARIDGCSELGAFMKISAPLMLPATATNGILLFVGWWGELLWASIELGASNMKTIPMGMVSFSAQFGTDWGALSAAVCIVLVPLAVFFIFTQKYFIRGLTGGAVKG